MRGAAEEKDLSPHELRLGLNEEMHETGLKGMSGTDHI